MSSFWNHDLESIFNTEPKNTFKEQIRQALSQMNMHTTNAVYEAFKRDITELEITDDVALELKYEMDGCDGATGLKNFLTKRNDNELLTIVNELFSASVTFKVASARERAVFQQMFLQNLCRCLTPPKKFASLQDPAFFKPADESKDDEEAFRYVSGYLFREIKNLYGPDEGLENLLKNSIQCRETIQKGKPKENEKYTDDIDKGGLTRATDEGYFFCTFVRELLTAQKTNIEGNPEVLEQWDALLGDNNLGEKKIVILSKLIEKLMNVLAQGQTTFLKEKLRRCSQSKQNKKSLRKNLKQQSAK